MGLLGCNCWHSGKAVSQPNWLVFLMKAVLLHPDGAPSWLGGNWKRRMSRVVKGIFSGDAWWILIQIVNTTHF